MRALTVVPARPLPESDRVDGGVLVATQAVGVCGTDREILAGQYGQAPPGTDALVLGHESVGEVLEAPDGCGLAAGDLVVGIVRRPDSVPCGNCAAGLAVLLEPTSVVAKA